LDGAEALGASIQTDTKHLRSGDTGATCAPHLLFDAADGV